MGPSIRHPAACSALLIVALASACGDGGSGDPTFTTANTTVNTTAGTSDPGTGDPGTGDPGTGGPGSSSDAPTTDGTGGTGTTGAPTTDATGTTTTATTDASSSTTGVDPNDPFGPPPPQNMWPPGGSDQVTPSGVPFHVDVPDGDTSQAFVVLGGWFVNQFSPADGAITIYINGDGVMGPMACPKGGFGVPHLLNATNVHEVLLEAGKNVQFDHKRVFVEGSNNNAGWGVEAALDPINQPLVAGVYVDWAEYNNAPCKAVNTPAGAGSPRVLFISDTDCDDTYCPLKSCVMQVQGLGYDVTFDDPLSPATCDCEGACPGAIPRPHFKGQGSSAPIGPWVMATSKP